MLPPDGLFSINSQLLAQPPRRGLVGRQQGEFAMDACNEISDLSEDELQQKHRKERKDLQAQIQQLKHAVPKGDKKRKREMAAQVAQLEGQLSARHDMELQQWTELQKVSQLTDRLTSASVTDTDQVDGVTDSGDQSLGVTGHPLQNKTSKAQRRREKKAQAEREREERIRKDEEDNLLGPRNVEAVKLKAALQKRLLGIFEIPSDGNCLYSAIMHQLHRQNIETSVSRLRKQVADHMRSHSEDFLPFITQPDSDDPYTPEQFNDYCTKLETTTEWGGQLEIRALSNVLRQPIEVIQADAPSIIVVDEHQGEPLVLSYHRHAYGLGEHYNSVVPKAETNSDNEEDGFN
ncbi:Deubiquitinase OTUD6B [Lamellibrachia satsuma]|nr:Deubiquitinase OTUD6B [Lamellibrachia satsuma]